MDVLVAGDMSPERRAQVTAALLAERHNIIPVNPLHIEKFTSLGLDQQAADTLVEAFASLKAPPPSPDPQVMPVAPWPTFKALLTKPSVPIVDFNQDLEQLFQNMFQTMLETGGVGLAAVQVGVLARAVVVHVGEGQPVFAANPRIIEASDEKLLHREGCLSFPGFVVSVWRPAEVTVEYQTPTGETRRVSAEGLEARCWAHEVDHLDGVTFLDRLPKMNRKTQEAKYLKHFERKLKR